MFIEQSSCFGELAVVCVVRVTVSSVGVFTICTKPPITNFSQGPPLL